MPTIKSGAEKSTERSANGTTSEPVSGWGAVAKRKIEAAEAQKTYKELREKGQLPEYKQRDGDSDLIQFLDDEPYCFDCHKIQRHIEIKKGPKAGTSFDKWETHPCQLATQKHCVMCDNKIRLTWAAAFRILDYRGKYDSASREYDNSEGPVEQYMVISNTDADALYAMQERLKGKKLTELVLRRTRSGSDKSTSYNYERALDDDDVVMKPIKWTPELEPCKKAYAPWTDSQLIASGAISARKTKPSKPEVDEDGKEVPY